MSRRLPLHPGHPERVCWGCAKYCPADDMACGNGTERGQHPIEIFGPDWTEHGIDAEAAQAERTGQDEVTQAMPPVSSVGGD